MTIYKGIKEVLGSNDTLFYLHKWFLGFPFRNIKFGEKVDVPEQQQQFEQRNSIAFERIC